MVEVSLEWKRKKAAKAGQNNQHELLSMKLLYYYYMYSIAAFFCFWSVESKVPTYYQVLPNG